MTKSSEFTPFDLLRLVKEIAEHDVEMKIRLAKAGITEPPAATTRPA